MNVQPLHLSHQELLSPKFKALKLDISEYSFANLYLFRKTHNYEVLFGDEVFVKGRSYDGKTFLMPTFDIRKVPIDHLIQYQQGIDFFYPLPEEWIDSLDKTKLSVSYSENDTDYIFSIEKLKTYPGRHLSGRRNLVHQFEENYVATSFPLTDERKQDALQVLEVWKSQATGDILKTDYEACKEAIKLNSQIGIHGKIHYIEQKPIAIILFEPLHSEMVVIHFAKADLTYKGVYQYLYQDFAKGLDQSYKWCNWEQDLGIEGLKHSKNAYLPDKLIKKMRVKIL
jgi:uncharacterized protein